MLGVHVAAGTFERRVLWLSREGTVRDFPIEGTSARANSPGLSVLATTRGGGSDLLCSAAFPHDAHEPVNFRRTRYWRATERGKAVGGSEVVVTVPEPGISEQTMPFTGIGTRLSQPAFVFDGRLWALRI